MKNILVINSLNGCACDLLSNIDDGTNSVALDIRSDILKNPYLEIESKIVNITSDKFLYVIPPDYYPGSGSVLFRIIDDDHTSDYFRIKQVENTDGNLFLLQISDFSYELALTSVQNETGVPIATDISLGVVKGGDNVGIRSNGTMYAEQVGIDSVTNSELDDICKTNSEIPVDPSTIIAITESEIEEICK